MRIAIYTGHWRSGSNGNGEMWDGSSTINIGGAELWCIRLSQELSLLGHNVYVYNNCPEPYTDNFGVHWDRWYNFEGVYDLTIRSRTALDVDDKRVSSRQTYYVSHDRGIFIDNLLVHATYDDLHMSKVDGIVVLSDWHKERIKERYPLIPDKAFKVLYNGVDKERYANADTVEKERAMVWSSCLDRGLTFFGDYIFPKVKASVPDFKLYICSYNTDIKSRIPEDENIFFLGSLDKDTLAEYQKRASVWCLPNYGYDDFGKPLQETFCMTAVENAIAGNGIVALDKGGISTTLKGYSGLLDASFYDDEKIPTEEEKEAISSLIANEMVKILLDVEYRRQKSVEAKKVCEKYTWSNLAKEWITLYEETEYNQKRMRKKLVYSFYVTEDVYDNIANQTHFKCLKYYSKIFDEIEFHIIHDTGLNKDFIEAFMGYLIDLLPNQNIAFKMRQNTPFGEAIVFKEAVIENQDNSGALVFFAHNKGVTNVTKYDVETILCWIVAMYYFSLHFEDEVIETLVRDKRIAYGSLLTHKPTEDVETIEFYSKNRWAYIGTMFWVNWDKLKAYKERGGIEEPVMCDRFYAEDYLGNIMRHEIVATSHNGRFLIANEDDWYAYTKDYLKIIYDDEYEEFETFFKNLIKLC